MGEQKEDFLKYSGDNIIPDGISSDEAITILKDFFLGENWYIALPVGHNQANTIIVDNILSKFPKQYKKFCKERGWNYK